MGLSGYLLAIAIVAVLVGWQALRKPVQRRLAFRDATRRPTETLLVIAGSLLGTALITGSFIVGDTLDSSIRARAYTQLGPVDETIEVTTASQAREIASRVASLDSELIDGVTTLLKVPASTATTGEPRRAEPKAELIELDFEEGREFGGDPSITGIDGPSPPEGSAVISEGLAEKLHIAEGDPFQVFVYGENVRFEVDRVLPQLGLGGFWQGFENTSHNVFVAPGLIDRVARDRPEGAIRPRVLVLVSNRGGVEEGATLTGQVQELIVDEIGASRRVDPVKEDLLEAARREGENFQELFLGIGAFAIIAGILLLVNIFVMLADERKSQLGMLRAVGMRRSDLIRSFVIEGSIYAFAASVLGTVVGIGVGWAIVRLAAPIFGGFEDFGLDLVFSMEASSLVGGFTIGLIISVITIVLTSLRISRVNIIAAIRDLPAEKIRMERKRNVIIGSVLALLSVGLFLTGLQDVKLYVLTELGPPLALFFLLPVTSRLMPRRSAIVLASALSLLWGIFGNQITGGKFYDAGEINAFVVVGILLTFSAVVLLSQIGDVFERVFARFGARKLSLRLGMSYPLAQRFRTGLTLGMYALVIFTMTFIAVLTEVFGGQVDKVVNEASGGYNMIVTANASNPPTEADFEGFDGVEVATSFLQGGALYDAPGVEQQPWGALGISEELVETGPPQIEERLPEFGTDADVWNAVLEDPELVVIPDFFLQQNGPPSDLLQPGDTISALDPATGRQVTRRIAGILRQDFTFSVYMSRGSLRELVGARASPSLFMVKTGGGEAESRDLATLLQGELFRNGVEADTFRSIVEEFQGANLQFFQLMQAYLALGLVVGIAGLGVVMVRSVRERRREIGVLRAIGFLAPQVRRAFLSESTFTALQGIVIGSVLALITAAQLVNSGEFGETAEFAIPWTDLGILTGAALVASLIATAWPARQASRIPPAVALRTSE
jgi:putative ABC transport system permease protein